MKEGKEQAQQISSGRIFQAEAGGSTEALRKDHAYCAPDMKETGTARAECVRQRTESSTSTLAAP